MSLYSGALFLIALLCIVAVARWQARRVEAHIRKHHPLLINKLFVPPPDVGPKDEESRSMEGSFRLGDFERSGDANKLNDAELNRLLWIRRAIGWLFFATLLAFVASMILARGS